MKKILIAAVCALAVSACTLEAEIDEGSTAGPESPTVEAADSPETVDPPTAETVEPGPTGPQQNAIRQAESYLQFSAFSRTGLIEQLEFEGFTNADATFAVDHLTVDWNVQAVEQAESYLEFSAFSCDGLVDQLEFEGFNNAQATHGANQTSACG